MTHRFSHTPIPPDRASVIETCSICGETVLRHRNGRVRGVIRRCLSPDAREDLRMRLGAEIDRRVRFWEGENFVTN